jgi:hypothetical protein
VLLNDPVAGDQDRDPVPTVRAAHRALRARPTDARREPFVADRLAERDAPQLGPDGLVKRAPGRDDRHAELAQGAREVGIQLALQPVEQPVTAAHQRPAESAGDDRALGRQHSPIGELEQAYPVVGRSGQHRSQRRGELPGYDDRRGTAAQTGSIARRERSGGGRVALNVAGERRPSWTAGSAEDPGAANGDVGGFNHGGGTLLARAA